MWEEINQFELKMGNMNKIKKKKEMKWFQKNQSHNSNHTNKSKALIVEQINFGLSKKKLINAHH